MKVFSVSSQPLSYHRANKLRLSAERLGLDVTVNAYPDFDWEGHVGHGAIIDWLELRADEEIILLTDLWDTFFTADANEITAKFEAMKTPILFSAEWCREGDFSYGPWTPGDTHWNAINGGALIGYCGALRSLFQDPQFWNREGAWNIQAAYRLWWVDHPAHATLDRRCEIFQSLYGRVCCLQLDRRRVYNRDTKTHPCHLHGHGGCYAELDRWWDRLNPAPTPQPWEAV